ncbi:MAG: hypothetical protein M1491_09130 [Deltaproteobacteria bacterium]|nr:hypothetical protein [Deltaproteobacteria bacterium]MCL5276805.1 hypothetical protein [Deltaproteobacteria bacterium]
MDKETLLALKKRLKELQKYDEEKSAIETLLKIYEETLLKKRDAVEPIDTELIEKIKKERKAGKSQLECIKMIATERQNKTIRLVDVKKVLLEAGVMKNSKSILGNIYGIIDRSGYFEKVDRGIFKLKEETVEQQLPLDEPVSALLHVKT